MPGYSYIDNEKTTLPPTYQKAVKQKGKMAVAPAFEGDESILIYDSSSTTYGTIRTQPSRHPPINPPVRSEAPSSNTNSTNCFVNCGPSDCSVPMIVVVAPDSHCSGSGSPDGCNCGNCDNCGSCGNGNGDDAAVCCIIACVAALACSTCLAGAGYGYQIKESYRNQLICAATVKTIISLGVAVGVWLSLELFAGSGIRNNLLELIYPNCNEIGQPDESACHVSNAHKVLAELGEQLVWGLTAFVVANIVHFIADSFTCHSSKRYTTYHDLERAEAPGSDGNSSFSKTRFRRA